MFANSVQFDSITNGIFLLDRCIDTAIGFEFLTEILESNPRYCNSVYVSQCVYVKEISPLDIVKVEFAAAQDPCFQVLNFLKKSEDNTPALELQLDGDDKLIGVIVRFFKYETTCAPSTLTYRLYGYDADDARSVLAQGLISFK